MNLIAIRLHKFHLAESFLFCLNFKINFQSFLPKTTIMRKNLLLFFMVASSIIATELLHAQPGAPDAGFGNNGFVLTGVGSINNSFGYDVVVQPDGKTVVSGKATISTGLTDAILIRFKVNGQLDSTFGTNGIAQESFTNYFDNFSSLSLQADGKFVVCGLSNTPDSTFVLFARYNSNGTLDETFRTRKTALRYYGFGNVGIGTIVQQDKKILLMVNNNQDVTFDAQTQIERYNENGTVDNSFATRGNYTYTGEWYAKFTQDAKGRIIALGGIGVTKLLRLTPKGDVDVNFGTSGFVTSQLSPFDGPANIVTQPDNKILVCGSYQASNFYDALFTVCRFNKNGSIDNSFNSTGINTKKITGLDYAYDIVVQPGGKIIAAGFTYVGSSVYTALVRYNTKNGHIDPSWGTNGVDTVTTTWDGKKNSYAVAAALTPDGQKIVTTGQQLGKNPLRNEFVTARFLLNPAARTAPPVYASNAATGIFNTSVYPNPAKSISIVTFNLKDISEVHAWLTNTSGQQVLSIYNGTLNKGTQTLPVDVSKLPSGIYYVIIKTGNTSQTIKLLRQ